MTPATKLVNEELADKLSLFIGLTVQLSASAPRDETAEAYEKRRNGTVAKQNSLAAEMIALVKK